MLLTVAQRRPAALAPVLADVLEPELARSRRSGGTVGLVVATPRAPTSARRRVLGGLVRPSGGTDRLRPLAEQLEAHVRCYDHVLLDPSGPRLVVVAPDASGRHLERLRDRLGSLLADLGDGVSIGVASSPRDGMLPAELLEHALDAASDVRSTSDPDADVGEVGARATVDAGGRP